MKKNFLTGIGLVMLLNFIIKPIWVLGIDRTVQNVVGQSEYGFYFIVFNFSLIFNIILDFGVTNFNQRTISQHPQLLPKFTSNMLSLKILLSLAYVFVIFIIALIIGYNFRQFYFLLFLGINQVLASFVLYLRSNITGMMLFKTDSILSVMDKLLMIFFCSVLLYSNVTQQHFQIEWFIYSQTAAYLITMIIAFGVVIKKSKWIKLTWSKPFLISLIRQTFPYALLSLLMSFYYRIDAILIGEILPGETGTIQAGIYAMGYRLLDVFSMTSFLVSFFLLPLFARYIKIKENLNDVIGLSFSILITLSVIASVSCSFYAEDIMKLLYYDHGHLQEASRVFQIIIWGFIMISVSYIFGTLLTANGNLKQLNIVALIGIGVSLTVNFLLIPRLMATGSAIASLATQSSTAILQLFIVKKVFKMNVSKKKLFKTGFFIIGTIFICFISRKIPVNTLINFGVAIIVSLFWAWLLKIIVPRFILKMWREEVK